MDKIRILEILITQMIIVLSLVFIIISLLIVRKNNKIIKKFNNYTVKSIKRANVSFFDKLIYMMEYIISKNAEVLKYKAEIKDEYLEITKYNIKNNYKDNLLTYTITLDNYPEGYSTLYTKGTVMKTISNKEKLKKWTCE